MKQNELIKDFIGRINSHDPDEVVAIFDSDIEFFDLYHKRFEGIKAFRQFMTTFYGMVNNYQAVALDVESENQNQAKIYVQTFGDLTNDAMKIFKDGHGIVPTYEQIQPLVKWDISFKNDKITRWEVVNLSNSKNPKDVALKYVWAINSRNPKNIVSLMTNPHEFIAINGKSDVRSPEDWIEGWEGYYKLFPDYIIYPENIHVRGDFVIILGSSDGTLSEYAKQALKGKDGLEPKKDDWQGPAIWSAKVSDGKLSQWRVYLYNAKTLEELDLLMFGYKALE
ncbi:MAG TPA: hypothetical protein PKV16_01530 [Caldisericia bacterium]|nr:hypothetical protein [Caldisericia bacterium]HPF48913.1 hypothetical protein [Caldisericia bacterium]HPI83223.1 hypothetical protein [Caldisericia bacterium]HPQ92450.1 hypothetical protein [Caldisericia bacterium]HRV74452.1 hypothetical protein [Caldisericia bacterium]